MKIAAIVILCCCVAGCATKKEYFETKKVIAASQPMVVKALLEPFSRLQNTQQGLVEIVDPQQKTGVIIADMMSGDVAIHNIPVATVNKGGGGELSRYLEAQERTKQFEALRDAVRFVASATKVNIAEPYNPTNNINTGIKTIFNPVNILATWWGLTANTGIENAGHNNSGQADKGGAIGGDAGSAPETTTTTTIEGGSGE